MSYEAMTWAVKIIEQNKVWKTPLRFVLLIMANRADEDGLLHPSVRWIMERTGLAESTVRDATRELQRLNLLTKVARQREHGVGQTSNEYRLAMAQFVLKLESKPLSNGGAPVHGAPGSVHSLEGAGPRTGPQETKDKKKEKKKDTPLPDGFGVSLAVREWATKNGFAPFLLAHLEYLVDWVKQNPGDWCADWDARLRNSIRADWGGVRKQAQIAARLAGGASGGAALVKEWWETRAGVDAKAAELKVEHQDDGERTPGENYLWLKAKVCVRMGEGPWLASDRSDAWQRLLKLASERAAVPA